MWFDLINNAELRFLLWGSKGFGTVLLAIILIVVAYLLRPVRAAELLIAWMEMKSQNDSDKGEPPPPKGDQGPDTE